jgi:TctA family transporter
MAVLIGVFIMLGIQPGPMMIVDSLPLVWTMIWALVIANIVCSTTLLYCAQWFGRITTLRSSLLVPCVFVLAMLGCYLSSNNWENILLLLGLGSIGYTFKRCGWPRSPFIIGIVLGSTAEQSFHKALAIWGPVFLLRPISLVLIALICASIGLSIFQQNRRASKPAAAQQAFGALS